MRTCLLKRVPSRLAFRIDAAVLLLLSCAHPTLELCALQLEPSFSFVVLVLEPCKSVAVHIFRQYPDEVVEQVEQIPSFRQAVLADVFIEQPPVETLSPKDTLRKMRGIC